MRTSSSLLLLAAPLALAACGPNIEQLQALSAGSIGCPQNEIAISHPSEETFSPSSWQADCRDHAFICGRAGFESINCTPLLPPVASATAPAPAIGSPATLAVAPGAAAPPPPPPEAPATACAEAADYDKRAAAASSPVKEQLLKIAAHKHHDCDAGRAPAAPAPSAATPVAL